MKGGFGDAGDLQDGKTAWERHLRIAELARAFGTNGRVLREDDEDEQEDRRIVEPISEPLRIEGSEKGKDEEKVESIESGGQAGSKAEDPKRIDDEKEEKVVASIQVEEKKGSVAEGKEEEGKSGKAE